MAVPTNVFQNVQTYQKAELAFLQNQNCWISNSNTKFKNFDTLEANLGDTVTFDKPIRYTVNDSLVATFQPTEQRVESLTVDKAKNVSTAFTAQQRIFNVKRYMKEIGNGAVAELGTEVEADIATVAETSTFRYYGDGITNIDSYQKLATALAYFRNFGAAKTETKGFLDDVAVPGIIGAGLTQFKLDRNREDFNSWEIGGFSNSEWYQSNLLPTHTSGTAGNTPQTLTVVSVTTDADGGISAILFSGATASDADAIKAYDLFSFDDGVSGKTNVRYRTFIGHKPCANKVQCRATADASADGSGQVNITISPKLYVSAGNKQNITTAIVAGMQITVIPSHRCGLIFAGNPLYLAMPRLPDEDPFKTVAEVDPDTGVSMRMYYGSKFGLNERGLVNDCIWGKKLVEEYAMRLIFTI